MERVRFLTGYFECCKPRDFDMNYQFTGTDIDTLCVVPRHVQREDFFNDMYDALAQLPEVTELTVL